MSNKEEKYLTWKELVDMKPGTVLKDWFDEGVRCLILRGPSALCAYVGVPIDHPLAGFNYDDVPLRCHGGLTFSAKGDGSMRPKGFYWFGYDYGHCNDYAFYYNEPGGMVLESRGEDKKWMVKDVEDDMWSVVYDFKMLMKLSEQIHKTARKA